MMNKYINSRFGETQLGKLYLGYTGIQVIEAKKVICDFQNLVYVIESKLLISVQFGVSSSTLGVHFLDMPTSPEVGLDLSQTWHNDDQQS